MDCARRISAVGINFLYKTLIQIKRISLKIIHASKRISIKKQGLIADRFRHHRRNPRRRSAGERSAGSEQGGRKGARGDLRFLAGLRNSV